MKWMNKRHAVFLRIMLSMAMCQGHVIYIDFDTLSKFLYSKIRDRAVIVSTYLKDIILLQNIFVETL
jgi:hypothetical protein